MKHISRHRLGALAAFLLLLPLAPSSARLLINEGHINPPGTGDEDMAYQYIELISVDENNDPIQEQIGDVQLLLLDSTGGNVGRVEVVLELNGLETGSNGLLLIGLGYDDPRGGVWDETIAPGTAVADFEELADSSYGSPLREDIGPKDGLSLLLVQNFSGQNGGDLDTDNNGILNNSRPWDVLLDSAGYGDEVRAYETDLGSIAGFTPDNFSRLAGNGNANDPAAWYGGTISGSAQNELDYNPDSIFGPITGQATPGKANLGDAAENTILINEVVLDHTFNELYLEGSLQFVELINTAGGPRPTTGLALLLVRTHSQPEASRGEVLEVWKLDTYSTGDSGLLLIGHDFPEFVGWGDTPNTTNIADPDGMGRDDIPSANGFSLLLVRGLDASITPRSATVAGDDLDLNNDGVLDLPLPWDTTEGVNGILDSVGASRLNNDGDGIEPDSQTYALVDLVQPAAGGGYMPDAVCRKRDDARDNEEAAWYGGTLSGEFAGNSPTNITFSYQINPGQGFFGGLQGALTPGTPNVNAQEPTPEAQGAARLVLNEVHINPPGDGTAEFVEILSTQHEPYSTRNMQLLIVDTAANQTVGDVWHLEGLSTGPNGLLVVGDNFDDESPTSIYPALRHRLLTHREDPDGVDGSNLEPNSNLAVLLVEGYTGPDGGNLVLDSNGDGNFDITPWNELVDSVAIGPGPVDPSVARITAPFLPQTLSRLPTNTDANSTAAWSGGTLEGTESGSVLYDEFFGPFASEVSPGAYNLAAPRSTGSGRILINEVHVNPPGNDDNYEYIELIATTRQAASTNDLTLVLVETSGDSTGKVLENWSLDGLGTGSNGLLLLGNNYAVLPDTVPADNPWEDLAESETAYGDPEGMGNGDIGPNDTLTLLLVAGYRGRVGLDLDDTDDGRIDDPPPWTMTQGTNDNVSGTLDSLGFKLWEDNDPPPGGTWTTITYARADVSQTGYQPDNVSRISGDTRSNLTAAWYGGDISGSGSTSVAYSANKFNTNSPDLMGARATPGRHNFGSSSTNPTDDDDGDGMTNAQEELAGTDPNNASDYLRIASASREGTFNSISWTSKAGKTYTVESSETMTAGDWHFFMDVPSEGAGETGIVFESDEAEIYYRVRIKTN